MGLCKNLQSICIIAGDHHEKATILQGTVFDSQATDPVWMEIEVIFSFWFPY